MQHIKLLTQKSNNFVMYILCQLFLDDHDHCTFVLPFSKNGMPATDSGEFEGD